MMIKQKAWLGLLFLLISVSSPADEKEDNLMDRFRAAYESGDASALVDLVYSEGLTDDIRSRLQESFQFNFDMNMNLTTMEMAEVPDGMPTERNMGGVIFKLNLEPIARLQVMLSLLDEDGNESGAQNAYLVGEHDGTLYIITGVPSEGG
jgi:hypothetical protein